VTLVRNPRYDPRTDSRAARENNPDRFVFSIVEGRPAAAVIAGKLAAGELDDAIFTSTPKVLGRYMAAARGRGRLRVGGPDWLFYISLNLTQPPFDDVHVRRALSWVLDRAAIRDAWGGAEAGPIARHLIPDRFLGGRLAGFAPFATPGDHGSVARATAEMAKSHYRTRNGACVASACKRVYLRANCDADRICGDIEYAAGQRMRDPIIAAAAKIGIAFANRSSPGADLHPPASNIAISQSGYLRDHYPDASDFVDPVFAGAAITATHNPNTSLVGITPSRAAALRVKGKVRGVPSVDRDLARCSALTGGRRLDCYAALDRKLSTQIVPSIPFLWRTRITILGPQVARWAYDESSGMTSFAHVALKR
jgi:ABC-type transport system substrate-binding protein